MADPTWNEPVAGGGAPHGYDDMAYNDGGYQGDYYDDRAGGYRGGYGGGRGGGYRGGGGGGGGGGYRDNRGYGGRRGGGGGGRRGGGGGGYRHGYDEYAGHHQGGGGGAYQQKGGRYEYQGAPVPHHRGPRHTQQRDLPVPDEPPFKAHLSNLHFHADEDQVLQLFPHDAVKTFELARDARTGRSRGFGIMEFFERSQLEDALELDGADLLGRNVRIRVNDPTRRFSRRLESGTAHEPRERLPSSSGSVEEPPSAISPPVEPAEPVPERPAHLKIKLKPKSKPRTNPEPPLAESRPSDVFGAARPREEVLRERGIDPVDTSPPPVVTKTKKKSTSEDGEAAGEDGDAAKGADGEDGDEEDDVIVTADTGARASHARPQRGNNSRSRGRGGGRHHGGHGGGRGYRQGGGGGYRHNNNHGGHRGHHGGHQGGNYNPHYNHGGGYRQDDMYAGGGYDGGYNNYDGYGYDAGYGYDNAGGYDSYHGGGRGGGGRGGGRGGYDNHYGGGGGGGRGHAPARQHYDAPPEPRYNSRS